MQREDIFSERLVIYTAITGGYDQIAEPEYVDDNADYICFTDSDKLKSDIWQIRHIDNPEGLDPVRLARQYKVLAHRFFPQYKYSFWVDGNVYIIGNIREYIHNCGEAKIACTRHPERDCIYDEAEACIQWGKDTEELIRHQVSGYHEEGFPAHYGLMETNNVFREHNDPVVVQLMEDWWREIRDKSRRDQLSLNYVIWKDKFTYCTQTDVGRINPYWIWLGGHNTTLSSIVLNLEQQVVTMQRAHDELQRAHDERQRAHDELQRAHDELQRAHDELQRAHDELQRAHGALLNSTSWKITKPLRSIADVVKRVLKSKEI